MCQFSFAMSKVLLSLQFRDPYKGDDAKIGASYVENRRKFQDPINFMYSGMIRIQYRFNSYEFKSKIEKFKPSVYNNSH